MKETRDVRIVKSEDDRFYCIEVFFNYQSSGKMELDDELSHYNPEIQTEDQAEQYISKLKDDYNIVRVEW